MDHSEGQDTPQPTELAAETLAVEETSPPTPPTVDHSTEPTPSDASTTDEPTPEPLSLSTDSFQHVPSPSSCSEADASSSQAAVPVVPSPPTSPTTPRAAKHPRFDDSPTFFAPPTRLSASGVSGGGASSASPATSPTRMRASTSSRRPSSSSASSPPPPPSRQPKPSLSHTVSDLRALLKTFLLVVPSSLRRVFRILVPAPLRRLAQLVLHQFAMVLHKRGALASNMFYDMLVIFWKTIITIFFREIRSRGAWKVPRNNEGAVIFVVGPHHNQFLDPLLLMSEVRRESGRRISFLTAAKSMDRKFIGGAAKLMQSIPVARAQDLAIPGKGTIFISAEDPLIVLGTGTTFLKDLATPRCQIMLPRQLGSVSVEVAEVLEDGKLKLKKEFNKKAMEGLKAKGESGVAYKILPYVDQSKMYSSVYQKLTEGGSIGVFPEGGSHDRTDLLPLKAGVSIMALGAMSSNPNLQLRIVPVGLSYFHPHKFRSRAVVEFGTPIDIPKEFVEQFERGGDEKKTAIGGMMDLVVDGLKSVTVRAPDYETLMLIQATRRLYRPPGQNLTLGQVVELNKRFIQGYEVYKEEPRLKALVARVKEYNTLLRYMGLKDHQIDRVARPMWRSLVLLLYRFGLFAAWGTLALPGVILNAPIFIAAKYISHRKAKEALAASTVKIKGNDVLGTWKVLVAMAGAPTLYTIYAIGATVLAHKLNLPYKYKISAPLATYMGLPLIGISALKFGEVGVDVYKSLRPLFLSLMPGNEKQLDKLRTMRSSLTYEINQLVEELAPAIFDDFHSNRIVPPTARPAPPPAAPGLTRRRSTFGPQGKGTLFTHPMSWVDEYLFGWSQSQSPKTGESDTENDPASNGFTSEAEFASGTRSGYVSGYTTDEPDYEEAINILRREQNGGEDPATTGTPRLSRRNSGRSRSRSQLDLTALNPTALSSALEDKKASARKGGEASS